VHIDLDAFYAAVEERDHPEWRGKPLAVGGMSMLSTANYEARKYGVASAMPGYIALKLCPDLLMVPLRFPAYEEASECARSVIRTFDPNFSSFSLDEASLDLTDYMSDSVESVECVVKCMRAQIKEATGGLTCSAGIACNRFLAKLASNLNKPDGQYCLLDRDPHDFVLEQPVRRLWGVGKVTSALLKGVLNVSTCRELWDKRHLLPLFLTPAITRNLIRCLLGISSEEGPSSSASAGEADRSSKSCETTFTAIFEPTVSQMKNVLKGVAEELAAGLKSEARRAQTISLKIKTADFNVFTRSHTLPTATDDASVILNVAYRLFKKSRPESVRLLGIRASKFLQSSPITRKRTLDEFLSQKQAIQCPICEKELADTFDSAINAHIDHCLHNSSKELPIKKGPMDKFLM
jgi:DNA polymerase kappa